MQGVGKPNSFLSHIFEQGWSVIWQPVKQGKVLNTFHIYPPSFLQSCQLPEEVNSSLQSKSSYGTGRERQDWTIWDWGCLERDWENPSLLMIAVTARTSEKPDWPKQILSLSQGCKSLSKVFAPPPRPDVHTRSSDDKGEVSDYQATTQLHTKVQQAAWASTVVFDKPLEVER